jgi:hypothetical protein
MLQRCAGKKVAGFAGTADLQNADSARSSNDGGDFPGLALIILSSVSGMPNNGREIALF